MHTTCFKTKKVYSEVGKFKCDYKIAVDIDFLLRAYKNNISFISNSNITYMRTNGISNKEIVFSLKEYKKALIDNGYNILIANICYFIKLLIYKFKTTCQGDIL